LALAFCAAVLVFLLWRFWRPEETLPVRQRSLSEVEFVYRCEKKHTFTAMGQVEPRECPLCGQPAHPVVKYECPIHGEFDVAIRFGDAGKVTHLRLPGRDWVTVEKGLRCPRCNAILERMPGFP
jgi:hypothetical protein